MCALLACLALPTYTVRKINRDGMIKLGIYGAHADDHGAVGAIFMAMPILQSTPMTMRRVPQLLEKRGVGARRKHPMACTITITSISSDPGQKGMPQPRVPLGRRQRMKGDITLA